MLRYEIYQTGSLPQILIWLDSKVATEIGKENRAGTKIQFDLIINKKTKLKEIELLNQKTWKRLLFSFQKQRIIQQTALLEEIKRTIECTKHILRIIERVIDLLFFLRSPKQWVKKIASLINTPNNSYSLFVLLNFVSHLLKNTSRSRMERQSLVPLIYLTK